MNFTLGGGYNIYEGRHFGEVIWAEYMSDGAPEHIYYDEDARKTDFNIFGKWDYQFNARLNAYLDLQYRRVDYELLGFDDSGNKVPQSDQFNFFNPKLGLNYNLNNNGRLYASFGVANREPNRNDYLGLTVSDPPRSERLLNTEIGFERNWQTTGININVYHMYYQDQLALNGEINDVGEFTRTNIDESYRLGVEINGGLRITDDLELRAGATLSENKIVAFDELIDVYDANFIKTGVEVIRHENTDLPFSPNWIASGELSYRFLRSAKHDLEVTLLGKYVGDQQIGLTSDPENVLEAYFFSDLRMNYTLKNTLGKSLTFTLSVYNWTDELYAANAWSYRYVFDGTPLLDQGFYPQAGRNFLAGVNVAF